MIHLVVQLINSVIHCHSVFLGVNDTGTCVNCRTDNDCKASNQNCKVDIDLCVDCYLDTQCSSNSCDTHTFKCMECSMDSHCTSNMDGKLKCNF